MKVKQKKLVKENTKKPAEQRKHLYTYWNELPFSKTIDPEVFFKTNQSKVKSFIIKFIRDGIEDDFSKDHNLFRRHAFSVKEIHEAFKIYSNEEKYSISNFHFHMNSLLKDGYLKVIEKILEGRQYQSYYGRTAITFNFFFNNQSTDQMKSRLFGPIMNLISEFNPDMDSTSISQLTEENFEFLKDYYYRIIFWYKTNYQKFYNAKIDLQAFLDTMSYYAFFHPALQENLLKVGSLINLNQIMSFSKEEIDAEFLKDMQGQEP